MTQKEGDEMLRENELTEFKKTTAELNDAMISISAMLNKHGKGKIVFGMKNDGTPFKFTITDSTLRDVSRRIFEAIRPQIFPVIETKNINGIDVIEVRVEGDDAPYSAFGRYYMRTADEDREISPSELRRIMLGSEYEENWEDRITKETIDDVDIITLERFRQAAIKCKRLPDNGESHTALLEKLELMENGFLTNAGKMLFSKNGPVVLKMAVFATDVKMTFLDISREEGNIFDLIDKGISYVLRNIRWRVELSSDHVHRDEIPEIPVDAVREAVINSFVHARYGSGIQHEISVFSNRVSITNPGSFANDYTPVDYAHGDQTSHLRNEKIARVLYLCGSIETFGSGIKKIYSLSENAGVSIGYINEPSYFTLEFSRNDRNIYHENSSSEIHIDDGSSWILDLLKKNPSSRVSDIAAEGGKSVRTIYRSISELKNEGRIERVGSKKTGYWKVKE